MIELLSIDLSNFCTKQCPFCYNHSTKEGNVLWKPQEVIDFCCDCIDHGIKAVSLGGGEPFEYDGVFDVIDALYPRCYLSVTSNGLPLMKQEIWEKLKEHKPDKIHLTIHNPEDWQEVKRVKSQLSQIDSLGIKPGLNLLVGAEKIDFAKKAYAELSDILYPSQIILVPQRYANTPTPRQLADVAGGSRFQSPSCLLACKRPETFVSVSWDKKVNSCSYAPGKQKLETLDYDGVLSALNRVEWKCCHK